MSTSPLAVRLLACVVPFVLACALTGCGEKEPIVREVPQTYNNMKTLGAAYIEYTLKNNKPPQKLDDLRPFVHPDIDLKKIAKSDNDGTDFEIVWGVDFRTSQNAKGVYPIVIYERFGKDGIRYVCQFNDVLMLDEKLYKEAYFPPGHNPAT